MLWFDNKPIRSTFTGNGNGEEAAVRKLFHFSLVDKQTAPHRKQLFAYRVNYAVELVVASCKTRQLYLIDGNLLFQDPQRSGESGRIFMRQDPNTGCVQEMVALARR